MILLFKSLHQSDPEIVKQNLIVSVRVGTLTEARIVVVVFHHFFPFLCKSYCPMVYKILHTRSFLVLDLFVRLHMTCNSNQFYVSLCIIWQSYSHKIVIMHYAVGDRRTGYARRYNVLANYSVALFFGLVILNSLRCFYLAERPELGIVEKSQLECLVFTCVP